MQKQGCKNRHNSYVIPANWPEAVGRVGEESRFVDIKNGTTRDCNPKTGPREMADDKEGPFFNFLCSYVEVDLLHLYYTL